MRAYHIPYPIQAGRISTTGDCGLRTTTRHVTHLEALQLPFGILGWRHPL